MIVSLKCTFSIATANGVGVGVKVVSAPAANSSWRGMTSSCPNCRARGSRMPFVSCKAATLTPYWSATESSVSPEWMTCRTGVGVTVGVGVGSGVYGAGVAVGGSVATTTATASVAVGAGVGVGERVITWPQPASSQPAAQKTAQVPALHCAPLRLCAFASVLYQPKIV